VFNHLTGLKYKKEGYNQIVAPSPFERRNILSVITNGINTGKNNRTPPMYEKIIHRIEEVIHSTPANVGIFCASYTILRGLQMNGMNSMLRRSGKEICEERPENSAAKNSQLLKRFKRASLDQGGVLLGVCGGRNSEGEDYPGDFMNSVIIVGIPYHLPTPRVDAKIKYYNKAFRGQGWVFGYLYPAMQRANQASGRPIRRETDRGVIIFMDERFKERIGWISDWVRKDLKILPDRSGTLKSTIMKFWR
jgi:DNA excision repair protein ERCC-2